MTVKHYTDLIAWQKAMDLVVAVYRATDAFPPRERFSLANQVRKAVVSVPSNIAEGQGRATTRDFVHSLHVARGSLQEVETQLIIARRLSYLRGKTERELVQATTELSRILNGLIHALSSERGGRPLTTDH